MCFARTACEFAYYYPIYLIVFIGVYIISAIEILSNLHMHPLKDCRNLGSGCFPNQVCFARRKRRLTNEHLEDLIGSLKNALF